jgi:two-component system cell cycle response regulator DivK
MESVLPHEEFRTLSLPSESHNRRSQFRLGIVFGFQSLKTAAMKTLYLIEDNQDNADLVKDLLADEFQVYHFYDAPSALTMLQDAVTPAPDLLLLDIGLPGMDGVALIKVIRSHPQLRHLPAIALTAHAMANDEARLLAAGFDGYVAKPIVDDAGLLSAINGLLPMP